MTENEKAATFIGWKPELETCHSRHRPDRPCRDHGLIEPHKKQGFYGKCPDMADPRNYMKALASVAAHYRVYLELPRSDWIVISIWKDKPLPPNILIAHEQGTDAGIIIPKALAALYDAEHQR